MLEQEDREGWTKLSLQFQIEQEACSYIMGFGRHIEVLEPKELRLKVKKLAEEIITLYSAPNS
jgi:predicted DNA-binding transcriptional regulator YafY